MALRHKFDLNLLLNQTNMARSNFYFHLKGLKQLIKFIYRKHQGRYGYRRITDELNSEAIIINHKPF